MNEDTDLKSIRNYRRLSADLATSGQPSGDELARVAKAGFKVVINLAADEGEHSLPDERGTVGSLGMVHEHIPVLWQRPTPSDLNAFFATMDRHFGQRVYVHCAANRRVSSFVLLYRVLRLGWRLDEALPDLKAIWQPDDTWQAFIDSALTSEV